MCITIYTNGGVNVDFEKFWEVWPKKVAKKKAESAWSKLTVLEKREALEALPNHIKYWEIKKTHIDYVPYPASWINAGRWEDELDFTPPKERVDKSWMYSQQGIEAKAKELGILGNGYDTYETLKKKIMHRLGMEIE
jgi:hypothetical protein